MLQQNRETTKNNCQRLCPHLYLVSVVSVSALCICWNLCANAKCEQLKLECLKVFAAFSVCLLCLASVQVQFQFWFRFRFQFQFKVSVSLELSICYEVCIFMYVYTYMLRHLRGRPAKVSRTLALAQCTMKRKNVTPPACAAALHGYGAALSQSVSTAKWA